MGDAVYPYVFAARWGTPRAKAGVEYDPTVDAATRAARGALAGLRVVKVDSEVRRFGDITFTYVVPVIEVYLNADATDPQQLAALAPPWSPVPWHVTVLMEEAVKRRARRVLRRGGAPSRGALARPRARPEDA